MKRIIFITVLAFFGICGAYAQNWTKETQKEFRDAKEVALVIDFSEANIWGVSYDKFPVYYSGKENKSEEYAKLFLEKMQNDFKETFFKIYAKNKKEDSNAKFKITYKFKNITEKAGFSGYFYVELGGYKSALRDFDQEDGRWNNFETLWKENLEKCFYNYLSPFDCKLYKYKKD